MNDSSNQDPIVVGLVQMAMTSDMGENLNIALCGIKQAAATGANLICLPELFRSPYFCIEEKCEANYLEVLPGDLEPALSKISKELKITLVAGSVYQKLSNGNFNSSLVFDSTGKKIGEYHKTHIPHDPAFFEQNYFTASNEGYKIFETVINNKSVKIGILICYDQWFPEAARSLALLGADIIFYPTAIGTVSSVEEEEGSWQEAWKTVMRGHAVANATVIAAVNRVGREHDSIFWGGSFVCNAFGKVVAEGTNKEEIITAQVDFSHNERVKEGWRFFKERRPDTYSLLTDKIK